MTTKSTLSREMFHNIHYIRHNQRRLEHLSTLGLDLMRKSVLEVGAGIGDHTLFYLDRHCDVTSFEPRPDNFAELVANCRNPRRPNTFKAVESDAWAIADLAETFDIVHAYGILYHLDDPERALRLMSDRCHGMLLLETCVSFGDDAHINLVPEPADSPTQSITGKGCRPTRPWIMETLKGLFEYVYVPSTQPCHEQFPNNWRKPPSQSQSQLTRAVFVASRKPLHSPLLLQTLPDMQPRQKLTNSSDRTFDHERKAYCQQFGISLVLDIGANTGQYAFSLREAGYTGQIVSFEPQDGAYGTLSVKCAEDPKWSCEHCAVGATEHVAELIVAANSVSSSLLHPTSRAIAIESGISAVARQSTRVRRLGDFLQQWQSASDQVMIKIDVQGTECDVMRGLGSEIRRVALVEMEASFFPVYEGEPLVEEKIAFMRALEFEVIAMSPGWRHPQSGKVLQTDLLFARRH